VSAAVTQPPDAGPVEVLLDNAQDVGQRGEQQDAFYLSDRDDRAFVRHGGLLALVADGMGGLHGGRAAGAAAALAFGEAYARKDVGEPIPDALLRALAEANAAVVALGHAGRTGTTLVAAVVHGFHLYWVSVGDSRLYLWRRGDLTQITTDHDHARDLDRAAARGDLSWDEARADPERGALTSFLGLDEIGEADRALRPLRLEPADRVLLCSDGLYRALPDAGLEALLASAPAGQAASALVDAALDQALPGQDNVTAVVLDLAADPPPPDGAGGDPSRRGGPARRLPLVLLAAALAVLAGAAWVYGPERLPGVGGLFGAPADSARAAPVVAPEPDLSEPDPLEPDPPERLGPRADSAGPAASPAFPLAPDSAARPPRPDPPADSAAGPSPDAAPTDDAPPAP
jgi:protein phosphatase